MELQGWVLNSRNDYTLLVRVGSGNSLDMLCSFDLVETRDHSTRSTPCRHRFAAGSWLRPYLHHPLRPSRHPLHHPRRHLPHYRYPPQSRFPLGNLRASNVAFGDQHCVKLGRCVRRTMTDSPVYVNPLKFSWTLSVNGLLFSPRILGRLALLIFIALF
jgi:hypothetical protein